MLNKSEHIRDTKGGESRTVGAICERDSSGTTRELPKAGRG
jgi:hypothetical protein